MTRPFNPRRYDRIDALLSVLLGFVALALLIMQLAIPTHHHTMPAARILPPLELGL